MGQKIIIIITKVINTSKTKVGETRPPRRPLCFRGPTQVLAVHTVGLQFKSAKNVNESEPEMAEKGRMGPEKLNHFQRGASPLRLIF